MEGCKKIAAKQKGILKMLNSTQDNYEFSGLKLTPAIFAKLIVILFDGKQFTRQTAISKVSEYHVSNGGIIEEERNLVSVFKRATQDMQKKNVGLSNKGYGTWELHYEIHEITEIVEDIETDSTGFTADETLGTGNNAVYVYYYDVYQKLASVEGKDSWACKIGRTDRDPIQRVIGQAGTCYPELPHVALIIYCDDSSALESAIHSVLKYQNKWIKGAPGTEWFLTSPNEIKEIYCLISKR